MYLLILFLPLINIFLNNRKLGIKSYILSIFILFLELILVIIIIYENTDILLELGSWINIGNFDIKWAFRFDSLTRIMLIPIILVSFLVQLYSSVYMASDPHITRYFSYLNLFTYQMLLLVTGDNLLILFLGWEGVGLASYLLVNFWFTRIAANMASLKAFFMNRVGDWGLSIGIILFMITFYDPSFNIILENINNNLLYIIGIFILIGGIAKSAQLGLHTWLTSAMEGPTPVSALLHAATMVTAGIYLIMRLSYFIEWSSELSLFFSWLGAFSALLGALGGLLEYDLKKIVAYSTISQLGYMVVACGINLYNISLWHLVNHAYFKALLFLSAGTVLHSLFDNQDIRKYGSLILYLPHLYNLFLIGNLSLIAFPFLTGFYSKDLIIELTLSYSQTLIFIFIFITAIITSLYSIRLFLFTFFSKPNFSAILPHIPFTFYFTISILAIGAIIFGYLTSILPYTNLNLFTHPNHNHLLDNLIFHNILSILPLIFFFIFILPIFQFKFFISTNILNNFNIYYHYFILFYLKLSNIILRYWDRGFIEIFNPYGLSHLSHYISFILDSFNTSFYLHYLSIILITVISFIILV